MQRYTTVMLLMQSGVASLLRVLPYQEILTCWLLTAIQLSLANDAADALDSVGLDLFNLAQAYLDMPYQLKRLDFKVENPEL